MQMAPVVSVIIPVYNGTAFIRKCMENLLRQSYKNLEIIVVDDGSTDHSADLFNGYPVRLLQLGINSGLSAARSAGMDMATGTYLHFMDIDDEVNTEFYEELVKACEQTESDMAVASMINEGRLRKSVLYQTQQVLTQADEKLAATQVAEHGYIWRYLFRRTFVDETGLHFWGGRFIEDLPFTLTAVYHAKRLVTVPGAKYFYKKNLGSILHSRDKAHEKLRNKEWRYVKAFRQTFARKHKLKFPGVPTSRLGYLWLKWFD